MKLNAAFDVQKLPSTVGADKRRPCCWRVYLIAFIIEAICRVLI